MSGLRTLPEALAQAARTDAGYCFVSSDTDTWCSYADVRVDSLRVARALREVGLGRGDLVALVLPDARQFLTTLFGASISRSRWRRGPITAAATNPATPAERWMT